MNRVRVDFPKRPVLNKVAGLQSPVLSRALWRYRLFLFIFRAAGREITVFFWFFLSNVFTGTLDGIAKGFAHRRECTEIYSGVRSKKTIISDRGGRVKSTNDGAARRVDRRARRRATGTRRAEFRREINRAFGAHCTA